MTMRLLALAFVLFAASPCYAGEDSGRYTMTTVGDSIWRLDSATGAMSVCGQKLDHWACESVDDDALALKAEVNRLTRENRELKDKLAKTEEKEAEAGSLPANPATQFPGLALDEMSDFVNKMIRSLQDLVRDLKQQEAGQAL
jgi:hypothetical protein